jgi:hypothetical protein
MCNDSIAKRSLHASTVILTARLAALWLAYKVDNFNNYELKMRHDRPADEQGHNSRVNQPQDCVTIDVP